MLTISAERDSQISLPDWYKKPGVVHAAINKALMHPKVTKYDNPYEMPDTTVHW